MVDQSSDSGLDSWMPFFWGIGIGALIGVLAIAKAELDRRGLIPSWVFGWISDKPRTGGWELSLIFLGCLGLWQIAKLVKAGALGDVTKGLLSDILSAFSLRSTKGRSRK